MFSFMRHPSRSAFGAIGYVTAGVLLMIWAGLWYVFYIRNEPDPPRWQVFTCVGIILSGLAVMVIGLLFGTIGRGAKSADNTVGVAASVPTAPGLPVVPGAMGTPVPAAPVVAGAPAGVIPPAPAVPANPQVAPQPQVIH